MRYLMFFLLAPSLIIAQNNTDLSRNNNVFNSNARFGNTGAQAAAQRISNPPRGVDGFPYLFIDFLNSAVIVFKSGEQIKVDKNINFNVDRNSFESKLDEHRVRSYSFDVVDMIAIGRRRFKSFLIDKKTNYALWR